MNNPIIKLTNANAERVDEVGILNVSGFVNEVIEKFFNGKLVELDDENKKMVQRLGARANKSNYQIVNRCLSVAEFRLTEIEKPVIELNEPEVKVKKKRRSGTISNNPSTNW